MKCIVYIEEYIGGNLGDLASPKVFLTPLRPVGKVL